MAAKAPLSDDAIQPQPDQPQPADGSQDSDLGQAQADVFGENPLLGPDGQPMERGSGSAYAEASRADKAHLEVVRVNSIVGDVQAAAKLLLDHTARLTEAAKNAVGFTAAAKAERADAVRASPPTDTQ